MSDPREDKLPKWAQELIAVERTKTALSWPNEPKPEPLCRFDGGSGVFVAGERPSVGDTLWHYRTAYGVSGGQVSSVVFDGHYVERNGGNKSRAAGLYYATERDATLALLWAECEAAADRLHHIRQRLTAPHQ